MVFLYSYNYAITVQLPLPEGVCNPFRNVHAYVAAHSVFGDTTTFKSVKCRTFRKGLHTPSGEEQFAANNKKTAGRINARRFLCSMKKSSY